LPLAQGSKIDLRLTRGPSSPKGFAHGSVDDKRFCAGRDPHLFAQQTEKSSSRLLYIDNLRWTMIILVISMHAADTYSPFGNWYFVDRRPVSLASVLVFGAWQMYLQSFFMGLLFFIAGYFVPSSFDRKGAIGFLRERAVRLGVPVLLYMFCVGPVTEYYVPTRGHRQSRRRSPMSG
jgi:peptidoglycan/LPS O-acetylase OafA/YrhL